MASTFTLNKKTYYRVTPDQWVEIEALYRAGASARVLAEQFRTTERNIYCKAGEHGWLRRDQVATLPVPTPQEAEAAVRAMGLPADGISGDAACRTLAADAPLDEAARAAARAAVGMLRDGAVATAQTYARVAGLLARLDRTAFAEDREVAYQPSERERAALALLVEMAER